MEKKIICDNIINNMTKRTRLVILLICILCFFIITPMLVAYSMGYRFDFEKKKIVATGGIYIRTFPVAEEIIINSSILQKPGFLANSVFVQSLLPKEHTVSIKKAGYYDYFKTISVLEKEVTKLENILLIKDLIEFKKIEDKINYFSIAPNNQNVITVKNNEKNITFNYFSLNSNNKKQTFSILKTGKISAIKWSNDSSRALIEIKDSNNVLYYLFDTSVKTITGASRLSYLDKNTQQISFSSQNPKIIFYIKNKTLYSAEKNISLPIINNIISYKISGTNIIWLSDNGVLYNYNISNKLNTEKSSENFIIKEKKNYEIIYIFEDLFLREDDTLFKFNEDKKIFKNFNIPIKEYKILESSDSKNLIFYNSNEIYLYPLKNTISQKNKEYIKLFSGNKITSCQWLNNDYIIFTQGNEIMISEIDYRGNINVISLPKTANVLSSLSSETRISVEIKNPNMYFNQQDQKIYVLTENMLISSDKITP